VALETARRGYRLSRAFPSHPYRCWELEGNQTLMPALSDKYKVEVKMNVAYLKKADLFDDVILPNLPQGIEEAKKSLAFIGELDLDAKVEAINQIRELLHGLSPFNTEPVDFVRWVKNTAVSANDYNPNSVAPPEMELLRLSIMADGYTQPVVTNKEDEGLVVIDGFHRNRVGKECEDVQKRVHGYLPVVQIRQSQTDLTDRMASTIRHNRARGKHRVEAMSDIVIELKKRNWSDEKIAKNLGMEPDEVLRLCQISGLAELFSDQEFSMSWDIEDFESVEISLEDLSETPDE